MFSVIITFYVASVFFAAVKALLNLSTKNSVTQVLLEMLVYAPVIMVQDIINGAKMLYKDIREEINKI